MTEKIVVIKRNGKKTAYNSNNVYGAIKKGFDGAKHYNSEDVRTVFNAVESKINKLNIKEISVNKIQKIIMETMNEFGFENVAQCYEKYKKDRDKMRASFSGRQNKMLKAFEKLNADASENPDKRENANVDGNTAMGTMLQFGATVSKEYAKSYQISDEYALAHEAGDIHIHDMDFIAAGCTTTCTQIPLDKLFETGFNTGHGRLRPPKGIMSYAALACIAIQSNQNDQHGGQAIPLFDFYMAPGVLQSFKKHLKQQIFEMFDYEELSHRLNTSIMENLIDNQTSIEFDYRKLYDLIPSELQGKDLQKMILNIEKAYNRSLKLTNRDTYQAMEALVANLNTMHSRCGAQVPFSSLNYGTDTSPEGRMVIKNILLAIEDGLGDGETPIFPISIFKVKEGVNYNPEDPNYDLLELACRVTAKRLFPNFSFLDSEFNKALYRNNDPNTEIAYMGCRSRVATNVYADKEQIPGRGNLSFTTINLPRLALKHRDDIEAFFNDLNNVCDMIKDQLLERFSRQCKRKVKNFPFLMGSGVWIDSDTLTPEDTLESVLKHGSLTLGFIGLSECLKALCGSHHGESAEAQELGLKIIGFIREKCDKYSEEYNLNFSLIATPAEGLSGRFVALDKERYGIIPGVTDKEYYTNSNHIDVSYPISVKEKLRLEAPYHALTNGGHIAYVELDGAVSNNPEAIMQVVRMMHDAGIGYGAINHPVDRDPVCGYTGVIGDTCPRCGRREGEEVPLSLVKKYKGSIYQNYKILDKPNILNPIIPNKLD
jgi:ribonucleoside-triphosphate reductase